MAESSAAAAAAATRQVMPGSFDPGDYIEFLENPFEIEHLTDIRDSWCYKERTSFWSTRQLPEMNEEAVVDWYQYQPPTVLTKTLNVRSDVLVDLVASSVANIAVQASEEARRVREQTEQKKDSDPIRRGDGEHYLPIVISSQGPTTPPSPPPSPTSLPSAGDPVTRLRAEAILAVDRSRPPGRLRFPRAAAKPLKLNLRRLFGQKDVKNLAELQDAPRSSFGRKVLGAAKSGSGLLGPQDHLSGVARPRTSPTEQIVQRLELM